jgi:hypothetical protein
MLEREHNNQAKGPQRSFTVALLSEMLGILMAPFNACRPHYGFQHCRSPINVYLICTFISERQLISTG